jgi:hypothetical protein
MMTSGPDLSALATDMLKWERMKRGLDELGESIKDTVMQIGKTQTVGNVRATYSKGRKSYDYRYAITVAGYDSPSQLEPWRKVSYDYRAACKELEIEDVPFTQGDPSVSLKLLA